MTDYMKLIDEAKTYDISVVTPLDKLNNLSKNHANNLWLKREDLQPIFSFKCRGSFNNIANLTEQQKHKGIIAASAGNHAQGVALSAKHLGIKAIVVMPTTTPVVKVQGVIKHGAEVILHGDNFDEAFAHTQKLIQQHGYTYVPPFDNEYTIAGNATVAKELLSQCSEPIDAVFVPVGGGGLLAGVAVYLKHISPNTKIIGIEPEHADSMFQALRHNKPVVISNVNTFADGVAVARVGDKCFELVSKYVDHVISVSTDEICAAIKDIFNDTRSLAEPSGAVATAGMKKYLAEQKWQGKNCIAIHTGANLNFDRLQHIAERAVIGNNQEALLAVHVPNEPASCYKLCQFIDKRSISEFNYRENGDQAVIFLGVSLLPHEADDGDLIRTLEQANFKVMSMTGNEIARSHIRHMVGGKRHNPALDELCLEVILPNRPNALIELLATLDNQFNISLLHYRDNGAAYAKVLIGFDVDISKHNQVTSLLDKAEYRYLLVNDNPAYKLFL